MTTFSLQSVGRRALSVCAAGLVWVFTPPAAMTAPPNILVILSDEHNAGVLGCYGNRIIQTPNIDRLAARGVRFEAAYTNSPLCVPCRSSMTAGKYVSRIRVWNNACELPSDDMPSIARIMNAAGYESYLCGKMHYDRDRRYGFTEVGGNMNKTQKQGRGGRRAPDDFKPAKGGETSARFSQFRTGDDSSVLSHDRKVTAGTIEFLRGRRSGDKPFFLIAGYLSPHFPLVVPDKYWRMYEGRVPMPEIPPGYLDTLALNYRHLRAGFNVTNVPPDTVRRSRELYYGLTTWLDDEIGKVLQALEASGQMGNTVVIYTTDHGENMGEHGMWWKSCMFDSAARIPLIMSWPGQLKGGEVRSGACSLVDLVQTIAGIGGATAPSDWDGDSLLAWMRDARAPWKDMAVSEYYAHHIASGYVMIRQGRYKYVYHTRADETHPPQRELYDLASDPRELRNLAGESSQQDRISTMHTKLVQELGEEPDVTEARARADLAKGYAAGRSSRARAGAQAESE